MSRLKKYLHLLFCSMLSLCSNSRLESKDIERTPVAGPMSSATAAPFPGNGGLGPQAAPFKPDDLAAQEEFNQILEELNQMPEEKLQELEQQLQAEVKRELETMTPERRAEFDREMAEFWRSQGVDPNQLPSLDEMLGITASEVKTPDLTAYQPEAETVAPQKKQAIVPSDYTAEDAEEIIGKLITSLENLRRKMAAYPQMTRKLQAWKEAIDDLVYYLKVMDQPEHHERIVAKEFVPLLKNLRILQKELATTEPQLVTAKKESSPESPYDILRILPTATDQEIQDAYDLYLKEHDPVALRAKLASQDFEEQEIEGRVKASTLNIRTVKDAYEKISNPKIRAQTDRALAATYEQSHVGQEKAHGAMNAILNALSQAIYQKNIFEDIQRFMKKYEPVKLEQRRKMEEAERKQRKEQESASKLKPTPTPMNAAEPYYLPSGPSYQPAGQGYYPGYGYGNQYGAPSAERGYGQAIEPTKAPEAAGGKSGGGKTGDKDDSKKDGAGKADSADKTGKEKEKKNPVADWSNALQTLNKELDLLDSDITVRDSTAQDKLRPKLETMAKLHNEIVAELPAGEEAEADEEDAEEVAAPEAAQQQGAGAAAPNPEQIKQLQELSQEVITFLESSSRVESLQKAMNKFAEANDKAAKDKTKIPNKEKVLTELAHKPAFGMLSMIAATPQPAPVRGKAAADLFATAPKTKKLLESVGSLVKKLVPQEEKAA